MTHGSSIEAKERIREAIDIVDLVGRYVELRRSGRNFVAHCPWHDDSRPSLQINPERQSWKCWVCDLGGDIFSFVMQIENVDFKEALSMLAEQTGIALENTNQPTRPFIIPNAPSPESSSPVSPSGAPHEQPTTATPHHGQTSGQSRPQASAPFPVPTPNQQLSRDDLRRYLFGAMAWAESIYHNCLLHAPEAEPARQYLAQRSISPENIDTFRIGFSPNDFGWILKQSGGNPAAVHLLEQTGVLARSQEGGNLYDRFRGRVLFPIHDIQGRSVGIGGRILPETGATSQAKYLNSPETDLFSKSHLLYGLDLARQTIRKSQTALIMEGYTDVIAAHQYGFTDAVAVLGTALGEAHLKLLRRFADRIVLVLDGDEAGRRRANEVLPLFIEHDVNMQILTLPSGSDPADFLAEHGAEAFRDMIDHRAVDALEHAFLSATEGVNIDRDIHAASKALEQLLTLLAKAKAPTVSTSGERRLRYQLILQRIATKFRIDEQELRNRLDAIRQAEQQRLARRNEFRNQTNTNPPTGMIESSEEPHDVPRSVSAVQARPNQPTQRIGPFDRDLLQVMLQYPVGIPSLIDAIPVEAVEHPVARRLYELVIELHFDGAEVGFNQLMLHIDDPAEKSLLVELDEDITSRKTQQMHEPPQMIDLLIDSYKRRELSRRRPVDTGRLREGGLDPLQELQLLQDIIKKRRDRHGIAEPKDGLGMSEDRYGDES